MPLENALLLNLTELNKEGGCREKKENIFSRAALLCLHSVQCLRMFNAHTQLDGGSSYFLFCNVWV